MRDCLRYTGFYLVALASVAGAFNHPEIQWSTVSTKHFLIHYYDKTQSAVYPAYKIAEESYEALEKLYQFRQPRKINLALADYDDFSNGFASWTEDNIVIWLPDSRFDLRSNSTWLRNVITHELAHIITLSKYGFQLLEWDFSVGYTSDRTALGLASAFPMASFYPAWFEEGAAQRESERAGHDCWDSRRDMLLRCAVLDNKELSLAEMGHFSHELVGSELVYNQGFSFVKHLESHFGVKRTVALWNEGRRTAFGGKSFKRLFTACMGRDLRTAYAQWVDSLRAQYRSQVPSDPTRPTVVWAQGTYNSLPKVSPDGRYWGWLTNHNDDFRRTDLVIARYGEQTPVARISYARNSWCFSRDGATVYFVKARDANANGSYYNDIFSYQLDTGETNRITTDARVYDIALFPDGKNLACVRFRKGGFEIARCAIATGRVTTVVKGTIGEPFVGLSFSPQGGKLAAGRTVDGKSNLYIVDPGTGEITGLCGTIAQEEAPYWGADNRIYYSADYDGVFNIYSVLPDGADMRRHTKAVGGIFQPVLGVGNELMCSEYTSGGFRIVRMQSEGIPYNVPNTVPCTFAGVPTPKGKVKIKASEYSRKKLRSRWGLILNAQLDDYYGIVERRIAQGSSEGMWDSLAFSAVAGAYFSRGDALGKKSMAMGLGLNLFAGGVYSSGTESDSTDSSSTDSNTVWRAMDRGLRYQSLAKRKGTVSPHVHVLHERFSLLRRDEITRRLETSAKADDDSTDAASAAPAIPLFLTPEFMLESRRFAPTIGLGFQVLAGPIPILVPAIINVLSYMEWHLARDWYLGVSPSVGVAPFAGIGQVQVPLMLSYGTVGYVNEDIGYNRGGITSVLGYIAPKFLPMDRVRSSSTSSSTSPDTAMGHGGCLEFGVSFLKGFPIAKYLSVVEEFHVIPDVLTDRFLDPFGNLQGSSRFYFTFGNSLRFVFPFLRNINAGTGRYYMEDLYGEIFYDLDIHSNDRLFTHGTGRHFTQAGYDTANVVVSHRVGQAVTLGMTKAYLFSRVLRVKWAWDIFRKRTDLELQLGF